MRRLSRSRAQEQAELGRLGERAAGHGLWRLGVTQPVRLVENHEPIGVLRASVAGEVTVFRARRAGLAGRRRREQRFGALVVEDGDVLCWAARERDRPAPMRDGAAWA